MNRDPPVDLARERYGGYLARRSAEHQESSVAFADDAPDAREDPTAVLAGQNFHHGADREIARGRSSPDTVRAASLSSGFPARRRSARASPSAATAPRTGRHRDGIRVVEPRHPWRSNSGRRSHRGGHQGGATERPLPRSAPRSRSQTLFGATVLANLASAPSGADRAVVSVSGTARSSA